LATERLDTHTVCAGIFAAIPEIFGAGQANTPSNAPFKTIAPGAEKSTEVRSDPVEIGHISWLQHQVSGNPKTGVQFIFLLLTINFYRFPAR